VQRRDDKKKHKQRTKELLQNILHKLEFINVELKTCKKRESKQNGGSMTRIEKETSDLFQEFQLLQLQYKHLEEERKKVERRQTEIENKLTRITSPKEEAVP
jgi:chaperonin cofactor prefoldin